MSNVVNLDAVGPAKARRELARWLREVADIIEADEAETEPHAALVVLTGMDRHELVGAGYESDGDGYRGAVNAAFHIGGAYYRRQGGNIATRSHPLYGQPCRKENIVQFGLPSRKPVNS